MPRPNTRRPDSRRPVIGITTDYNDKQTCYESPYAYAIAVEKAGGLPVLLPYQADLLSVTDYADLIDGMLFTGGNDLDPKSWGETYHPKVRPIDPVRERFEMALMAEVEKRRTPTLGICLGSQLMNVYRGGSLNQFLPEMERPGAIEHRYIADEGGRADAPPNRHDVLLEPQSLVAQAIGKTELNANSSHKQSVRDVGRGLRIIGKSPDGIVEGVEDPSMPLWLGVQWHPERMHDEPDHLAIFKLLVERSAGR